MKTISDRLTNTRLKVKFCFLFYLVTFSSLALSGNTLNGVWKTNDDTGSLTVIIRIEKLPDQSYEAKVEKILPDTPENADLICSKCMGSQKNLKIVGMRILKGLRQKTSLTFDDGEILDPDTGKIYQCFIRLSKDGQEAEIIGYHVFHWLGESDIWRRMQ